MRSSVVKPLTAGFVSSAWRRSAMIAGQPWASSDAPVPMVYESPRARYLLPVDVGERAPHFDLRAHSADHLVREVGRRSVTAQVRRPDAVRHRFQGGLV